MRVLTPTQREQLQQEGYVVVDEVLDPDRDIAPIMAEYAGVLDSIARSLYDDGAIQSLHRELPFDQRLIQMYLLTNPEFGVAAVARL